MKNGKRKGGSGVGKNKEKTIFTQNKTEEGQLKKGGVWGAGISDVVEGGGWEREGGRW
jgi:hypothetical protein